MASESGLSQNDILNSARKERKRVQIYLVNGIRIVGHVESFDQYVVMLRVPGGMQVIYKKAISTVQHDTPDSRAARSSASSRGAGSARGGPTSRMSALSRAGASANSASRPVVVTRKRRVTIPNSNTDE
ncbi:RNA chaperone Hfq [Mycetohabitans sp. B8]|uniref:RNA chaperone Hfq n=1 Tax=Mycetohabitans sp. B8 TaxID=2841845 RepID=UPI001F01C6E1|nr:RNA chaperone Hfq [Mycetohabitans sp. B8]MCG1042841.1 RNA chaperone Hfq [Mycetohabitans sp. B8]